VEVVGHGAFVDLGRTALLGTNAAGEIAEVVGRQRHVGIERFAHGLAVVPAFGNGQHFQVLLDTVGDFQQHQGAVLHRGLAPGFGGGMRSVQRPIDVLGG